MNFDDSKTMSTVQHDIQYQWIEAMRELKMGILFSKFCIVLKGLRHYAEKKFRRNVTKQTIKSITTKV